jgi:hypothetical protein
MTFTFRISEEEPYTFTVEKDGNDNLTVFTATDGSTEYDCSVHLQSETNAQVIKCCRPEPIGCVEGPC